MRVLGGGSNIPQITSQIPLEKERGIHQSFQRREAGEERMCSTSSWKGKDGEDSALALQGTGTWMLGEVGKGISSTSIQKCLVKDREGIQRSNSQRKIPVQKQGCACVSRMM